MKFILASQSPRRKEILAGLGVQFEVITSEAHETCTEKDPHKFVKILSERKGEAVRKRLLAEGRDLTDTVIIASDTVVYADGEIFGKPKDAVDAKRMLLTYSGKEHEVISGIYLCKGSVSGTAHESTFVAFDKLTDRQIDRYIETVKPYDKAGAYAIQGSASEWISGIRGDYFNVVGLPVHRMAVLFRKLFGDTFPM